MSNMPHTVCPFTSLCLVPMTNAFFDAYCDEAYALLSQDWIENSGMSPSGFNLAGLTADMQALRTAA